MTQVTEDEELARIAMAATLDGVFRAQASRPMTTNELRQAIDKAAGDLVAAYARSNRGYRYHLAMADQLLEPIAAVAQEAVAVDPEGDYQVGVNKELGDRILVFFSFRG